MVWPERAKEMIDLMHEYKNKDLVRLLNWKNIFEIIIQRDFMDE
jgi:hypothetical protein